MGKKQKTQQTAPEMVEQTVVVAEVDATISEEQLNAEMEQFLGTDEPPFMEELLISTPTPTEEVVESPAEEPAESPAEEPAPAAEPTEEEKKGYRVVGTSRICDLKVGQMYKREDSVKCKTWTVVLKEEGEKPKMLVSSSPKNTHNPRKEYDMEVVVIELV